MLKDTEGREGSRFMRWFHETFHDWVFRSLIGPAQTKNALDGSGQVAHDRWRRDLEQRKRYSREQREGRRRAREAQDRQ
jgi:hypothetical protein